MRILFAKWLWLIVLLLGCALMIGALVYFGTTTGVAGPAPMSDLSRAYMLHARIASLIYQTGLALFVTGILLPFFRIGVAVLRRFVPLPVPPQRSDEE